MINDQIWDDMRPPDLRRSKWETGRWLTSGVRYLVAGPSQSSHHHILTYGRRWRLWWCCCSWIFGGKQLKHEWQEKKGYVQCLVEEGDGGYRKWREEKELKKTEMITSHKKWNIYTTPYIFYSCLILFFFLIPFLLFISCNHHLPSPPSIVHNLFFLSFMLQLFSTKDPTATTPPQPSPSAVS